MKYTLFTAFLRKWYKNDNVSCPTKAAIFYFTAIFLVQVLYTKYEVVRSMLFLLSSMSLFSSSNKWKQLVKWSSLILKFTKQNDKGNKILFNTEYQKIRSLKQLPKEIRLAKYFIWGDFQKIPNDEKSKTIQEVNLLYL